MSDMVSRAEVERSRKDSGVTHMTRLLLKMRIDRSDS